MKKLLLLLLMPVMGYSLTGRQIIRKLDHNQVFQTQKYKATMTINRGKKKLVKKFQGVGQRKGQKSFMKFTNPEDEGVKYLKIENEMWIYFPDADDTIKLSGHMMRQGLMGSDLSYEDMMDNDSMDELYSTSLGGDTNVRGIECYKVILEAKKSSATYVRQEIFVDKNRFVLITANMYAHGDRLIKVMWQGKFKSISGKYIPTLIGIQDMRKKNSETLIQFDSMQVNVPVSSKTFTKQNLKR